MEREKARNILLLASVVLFSASLFVESIPHTKGLAVLVMGWMEMFAFETVGRFVAFAWFANVLFLVTLALGSLESRFFDRAARVVGAIALGLCLGYMLFGQSIVIDESGETAKVTWTSGYALWTCSILAATARPWIPRTASP